MNPQENKPPVIEYNSLSHASRAPNATEVLAGVIALLTGGAAVLASLAIIFSGFMTIFWDTFTLSTTPTHHIIFGLLMIPFAVPLVLLALKCFQKAEKFFARKHRAD